MAAEATVKVLGKVTGLGHEESYVKSGTDETTPTAAAYMYRTIATANTAEALDLGDIATVTGIIIWAVDYDLDIDTDFVTAFDADQTAKAAGIPVIISYPAGTVYVKGETDQTTKYEYLIWGTT